MTSDWKEYTVQELIDNDFLEEPLDGNHGNIHPKSTDYVPSGIPFIMANDLKNGTVDYKNCVFITEQQANTLKKGIAKPGDVLLTHKATIGRTAIVPNTYDKIILTPQVTYYRVKNNINNVYLKYYFDSPFFQNTFINWACSGSTRYYLGILAQHKLPIILPPLETQQKIAKVLGAIDDKIELNNSINKNLEQQAQAVFVNMFSEHIENLENENTKTLSELVTNIDNRGKTPPLSVEKTNYPIIDVRALSGDTRIINYNNCTKYVTEDTYNNWFRSGHPQKYDILLSTVGSLAEMKLFLGNIGCIAQNVVGYRCKISPLYMYQYLSHIKKDLLAYDIGSVQPSIKVTHIAKHPIYIPQDNELKQFHEIAEAITNEVYLNSLENERLTQLRDTLLPKLMNGKIDVNKVEV